MTRKRFGVFKTMVTASERKREVFEFFNSNVGNVADNTELLRSAKELVGLFGKVIRGYKLYPRSNPAFSKFGDQFKTKLDDILSKIPTISLKISPKGFMVG
jgi:hypothetical protein